MRYDAAGGRVGGDEFPGFKLCRPVDVRHMELNEAIVENSLDAHVVRRWRAANLIAYPPLPNQSGKQIVGACIGRYLCGGESRDERRRENERNDSEPP
jgi:hypothetical protein